MRPIMGVLGLCCVLLTACNVGDDEARLINSKANNVNNTNNVNNVNNVNNSNNANNVNNVDDPLVPAVQAFRNCAAGGTATGGDIQAITCTGGDDLEGFEASGGNVVWQPGSSSVVLIK